MSSNIFDIFGKEESFPLFTSQEIKSNSNFIYYFYNSISSFTYLFGVLTLLQKTSLLLTDKILGGLLILLSFVSFLWWACQRKIIHIFDIMLYSLLIPIIGLYILEKNNIITSSDLIDILINIFLLLSISIIFKKNNFIKIINIVSSLFSLYVYFKYNDNLNCILFFICGIIFKLIDTYKLCNLSLISGTAIFHILTGIGYNFLIKSYL